MYVFTGADASGSGCDFSVCGLKSINGLDMRITEVKRFGDGNDANIIL